MREILPIISFLQCDRIRLFSITDTVADFEHGGRLPVHVHFVMDEFANGTQSLDDYIGQGHKGRM